MEPATRSKSVENTDKKIKVLLDARKFFDGGIGTYIQNLTLGLTEKNEIELTLIASKKTALKIRKFLENIREPKFVYSSIKPYSFSEYFLLSKKIKFSTYDLFHSPHYTLPYFISTPKLITIHDLIHVNHPDKWYKKIIGSFLVKSALKRADRVISVSKATSSEIKKFYDSEALKIVTIPNALKPKLNVESDVKTEEEKKFSNASYFLAVISLDKPRKGIDDLIEAFSYFLAKNKSKKLPNVNLYLVGLGVHQNRRVIDLISKYKLEEKVKCLGRVSDTSLSALYAYARALVIPSTAEGFCLQAIEAQSFGRPIISRPLDCVKELSACSTDVFAKDFSVSALTEAILDFSNNYNEYKIEQDFKQREGFLGKFKYTNKAQQTFNLYKSLL